MPIALGVSLQADLDFLRVNRALIEDDAELYEINPETLWSEDAEPSPLHDVFAELLERSGRPAVGHGILYSLGAAAPPPRRQRWLEALQRDQDTFGFRWFSEHLGFADAGDHHTALPLPLPPGPDSVDAVARNLAPLRELFGRVAFENNVGYFALGDPLAEPGLFRDVCERTGCSMVLDLHNAYTTCLNAKLDLDAWLTRVDLSSVLEIHLSGGSDSDPNWLPSGRTFRLDSHDGPVPEPVWSAFERVLPECTALEAVVLEWMPDEMDEVAASAWGSDFERARRILR